MTLSVRVIGLRRQRFRSAIGVAVMRIGVAIIGAKADIVPVPEE